MKIRHLFFLCLVFTGCHTIRPPAVATPTLITAIPQMRQSVTLLMDDDYTQYVSKDRGNALADPQTYYVGEALGPLTKSYFEEAFYSVEVVKSKPSGNLKSQYLIQPKIKSFENAINISDQSIAIFLEADIYDASMDLIKTVNVQGLGQGELGVFGTSKRAGQTVNLAAQNALINLLKEISKNI